MTDLISRACSELEVDPQSLRNALDQISSDLTIPFLEKRARAKSHKNNPLEELSVVIQELTGRERELQAAIGISKMLLDRNDELLKKKRKIFEKKHFYKSCYISAQSEIETMKAQIAAADFKYQQLNHALFKSEEDQIKLLAENKRIVTESVLKQELINHKFQDNYENELFEVKNKFQEYYDNLLSTFYIENKLEAEKKIKSIEETLLKSETLNSNLSQTISKLEKENNKHLKKIKDLEELLKITQDNMNSLEDQYRDLKVLNLRCKAENEKLTEELDFYRSKTLSPKKTKARRQLSLMSELEIIDEAIPDAGNSELFTLIGPKHSRKLETVTQSVINIASRCVRETNRRKDPSEEYFTLVFNI
jgi:hypothetical protein